MLFIVSSRCGEPPYLITTALTEMMIEPNQAEKLEDDIDEAIWEEIETTMRHQGRASVNFLSLMGLGGIMATVGILAGCSFVFWIKQRFFHQRRPIE